MLTYRLISYWKLLRPFTLIVPSLGMLSGSLAASGLSPSVERPWALIALGVGAMALLNGASNALNQIYDLDIDRINKPQRPLPAGTLSIQEVGVALALYCIALTLAALVNRECFLCTLVIAAMTYIYSAPPVRAKGRGVIANIVIAVPRGILLPVAGWSVVNSIFVWDPWWIGSIMGVFLLGAATTKDFADVEGDKAYGCMTLPVKYGVKKTAWLISPFFIFPFLLIPVGALLGYLQGNPWVLCAMGGLLTLWGGYTIFLILSHPRNLSITENHVSWKHMYLMSITTQVAFATAYLIK